MEGGRKKSDMEREREEGDKNKDRKMEVGEAGPKKDRLESDDEKRRTQIEQEGQAGPSKEKMGEKEKERERLKIWKKEMDRRKALTRQGEEEVKLKNEKHIEKKGHKQVELLKEMTKKEQREVEARPQMKRKTNEDEDEPEKKTKNTVELKELGPTKNPAEEKDMNRKDLKKHLMKIKKQKEERRKQLKEAEYQKEMAKKQNKAAELLLKDLNKKELREAEFLKVWPKNEKIKDTVEQKGLGLKTHLMRIKKEKEAMRKELKEEELQKEMEKKLKELLKETTQKWQKQAELLTQVIRKKDEAELQKLLKKAQNEVELREMINQEKVTEVEQRKISKNTVEQKGLGLKTHLMRIKKEKEAMRKELNQEELQNEMEKKQATGVELLKETTQKTLTASLPLVLPLSPSPPSLITVSDGQAEKLLTCNRANRAAAVHCNHQQADAKNFEQSIAGLHAKIDMLTQELAQAKTELTVWDAKCCFDRKWHVEERKKRKATGQLEDQPLKLNIQAKRGGQADRHENLQN